MVVLQYYLLFAAGCLAILHCIDLALDDNLDLDERERFISQGNTLVFVITVVLPVSLWLGYVVFIPYGDRLLDTPMLLDLLARAVFSVMCAGTAFLIIWKMIRSSNASIEDEGSRASIWARRFILLLLFVLSSVHPWVPRSSSYWVPHIVALIALILAGISVIAFASKENMS